MRKFFPMLSFVFLIVLSGTPVSADLTQSASSVDQQGLGEFKKVRAMIDYLDDTFISRFVKLQDLRLSPVIRADHWQELPFEATILTPDDQIIPDLNKLAAFKKNEDQLETSAINISVSAETVKITGKPLLVVSLLGKLYSGDLKAVSSLKRNNERLANTLSGLLSTTTFTPQIRKKSEETETPLTGKHWLSNMRMDNDGRTMITGYAVDLKSVTRLGEDLLKTGIFSELHVHNVTKNVYEKTPVWRFEMSGKAK